MNINELKQLSVWYVANFTDIQSRYSNLIQPIQHNASGQGKQPLEPQLESLIDYLKKMKFEELSIQQIKLLDALGVSRYIGEGGANFVENTIRTSDYDPQTAVNRLNEGVAALSSANSGFSSYRQSLSDLGSGLID